MINYITHHPWKIIEDGFHPQYNRISESLFSIGNGKMGQRGNFEESYSGDSLQGSYIAGIYYPDKTRVGWWKNGYPEYFAKVLNSVNWMGLHMEVDGEILDLNQIEVLDFKRVLDMKQGLLSRTAHVRMPGGAEVQLIAERFYSMADDELAVLSYKVQAVNKGIRIKMQSFLDFDIVNEDSNYDEKFWNEVEQHAGANGLSVRAETKKLNFQVQAMAQVHYEVDGGNASLEKAYNTRSKYAGEEVECVLEKNATLAVTRYASITSTFYHDSSALKSKGLENLERATAGGYSAMKAAHVAAWAEKWEGEDIEIEGDVAAQQGIRFNIFHLNQTYTGNDPRLNIGPKGFTGEKYGGSTYWDTEAYCLPFYLSTAEQTVARNLLMYRYNHLEKAIENAAKLGFANGAALYPMVTMNGEECHNEWEITFEEIHRNGAIAYAIYDYVRYTGDEDYIYQFGIEVLLAISRFWAQRFNYSQDKKAYVMLGVTGPNEYENNVNNNWYTNYIAKWCMEYTAACLTKMRDTYPNEYELLVNKTNYQQDEEGHWKNIASNCYFPFDETLNIFLQQDGFLDKVYAPVEDIPADQTPINKHWSWDRILRSCYIKQADVLQGMYFFENDFSQSQIKRHFDYYEPITVHESSLSPCVHVIVAAVLGYHEKAYELYLRTARLDLDDYNADSDEGCHITSMAGTWMAVVKGFGGMRVKDGVLCFDPFIPDAWKGYSFKVRFRGVTVQLRVTESNITVGNLSNNPIDICLMGEARKLNAHDVLEQRVFA